MSLSATFCKIPVSVSVNPASAKSLVSLDWILTSGLPAPSSSASGVLVLPSGDSLCSMNMKFSVASGLSYDLVLGRDWIFFCRETLPHASFLLSSGIFPPPQPSNPSPLTNPTAQALAPLPESFSNDQRPDRPGHGCTCDEPLLCRCPSTSASLPFAASMIPMTSSMMIRDVLLGHHVTRSRISVFHSDLCTIQRSLDLHAIPHTNMTLITQSMSVHPLDRIGLPVERFARISSRLQIWRKLF
ncbi:ATP-dependent DNA helicase [Mycena sanguinolenta]|uniref:ATP-dependent DNA helicase n=1 Tax=Mycena sanguinolenta TaxID=230812 RepID=A0A8H6YWX8_9AGAR|nr:ATP-dependent DNA helicase [Mycena sanguinolenta]